MRLVRTKRNPYEPDRTLLANIKNIMFKELAVSLDTSYEDISKKVKQLISQ